MDRVGSELVRSRPVHSAFYGSFGAHSCPLSRSLRHDRWAVAISSMDFLIGTNQGFRQSLSVIRVHIRTHAPLSPQQRGLLALLELSALSARRGFYQKGTAQLRRQTILATQSLLQLLKRRLFLRYGM